MLYRVVREPHGHLEDCISRVISSLLTQRQQSIHYEQGKSDSCPYIQLHPWEIWTVISGDRTGKDRDTTSTTRFRGGSPYVLR